MASFCPYCGKEVKEGVKFCPNCGGSLESRQEEAPTISAEEVKNNTYSGYTNNGTYNNANQGGAAAPAGSKSKIAAGLFGIFLGSFGVHNFYLGNTGKAVTQLLLTVLSCGILSPISAIWGLIEGILILSGSISTDAKGNRLAD